MSESIIKMNKQAIRGLRAISRKEGLCGDYKFNKANLTGLLSEQSTEDILIPPPRTNKHKRSPVHAVKVIPHPKEMVKSQEQQMVKMGLVIRKAKRVI